MMHWPTLSGKKTIVLDIGSSGAHGAVVSRLPDGRLNIVKVSRSRPLALPEVNLKKLWKKVYAAAGEVAGELLADGSVSNAVIVFSSPWYFSEVRQFSRASETPFAIDARMLNGAIAEEKEKFHSASLARFHVEEDEVAVLEPEMMRATINGYPVASPIGNRARAFDAHLYVSAVFGRALSDLELLLHEKGIRHLDVQTSPFVFFRALGTLGKAADGRVIVDVGGEITEVSLIRGGVLYDSVSYARGFNYMARRLSESLSIELEDAIVYLQNYNSRALESSKAERTGKILVGALSEWKALLEKAFDHLASKELLPEILLVSGPGSALSEFDGVLGDDAFKRFTIFGRPFTREAFLPADFAPYFAQIPSVFSNAELTSLLVDLLYVSHRVGNRI